MYRAIIALFTLSMLVACGGGGGSKSTSSGGGGGGGGGSSPANPPVVVNVSASQNSAGVDINTSTPLSTPPPNATLLGAAVVPPGGGNVSISLSNTGATVHQGNSVVIGLIGDGLTASMTIAISGPPDITVDTTSIKAFTSSNGKPGITFQAVISPSAGLGGRTVLLKNAQNDITSFTGGLEVVP